MVLDQIRDWLGEKASVRLVANDPHLSAEILLLVRTMFIDGELAGEELALFNQICTAMFHLQEDELPDILRFLKEVSYETSGEQAASLFKELPVERKKMLLAKLIAMARADSVLHANEVDLIRRVGLILGYSQEEISRWL